MTARRHPGRAGGVPAARAELTRGGVRRLLHPHRDEQVVRDFDDRLYGWEATLTATRT